MDIPPPPGLNYIEAIRPSLNFILVVTPLGSMLVPLILTLFFFSPPRSRRHPVFILNILACCSGICEAASNAALETKQILFPLQPISKDLLTTVITFAIVSPLFIDSILLFRIFAFYPLNKTPRRQLLAIFALPIVVKCGRFTAVVMYLYQFTHSSGGNLPNVLLAVQTLWPKNPYIITEWSLQMIDNALKLVIESLLAHLHSLFIIALGNFVFPVVMNIASIALIATDPSFVNGSYVLLSNNYVAIIGVVFATIWTRRQNWNKHDQGPGPNNFLPNENEQASRFMFDTDMVNARSALSTLRFGGTGTNEGLTEQPADKFEGEEAGYRE